jgi:hypothetical protein
MEEDMDKVGDAEKFYWIEEMLVMTPVPLFIIGKNKMIDYSPLIGFNQKCTC